MGKKPDKPTPGEQLAAARIARGWNQRQAANALGCSPGMFSRIEAGKRFPGLALAFAMEDEGMISARDWLDVLPFRNRYEF